MNWLLSRGHLKTLISAVRWCWNLVCFRVRCSCTRRRRPSWPRGRRGRRCCTSRGRRLSLACRGPSLPWRGRRMADTRRRVSERRLDRLPRTAAARRIAPSKVCVVRISVFYWNGSNWFVVYFGNAEISLNWWMRVIKYSIAQCNVRSLRGKQF